MSQLNIDPDTLFLEALAGGGLPYTGRYLVTFQSDATDADVINALSGIGPMARASDFSEQALSFEALSDAAVVLFETVGVALVTSEALPVGAAAIDSMAQNTPAISSIDPEEFVFPAATVANDADGTWGLNVTGVIQSGFSGAGMKVAVLDTGMDLQHPDFVGRNITSRNLIDGNASAQDIHGHGTHCIGTACGPRIAAGIPRYGIAYNSEIFVGKVLSDSGVGTQGAIVSGMMWAIEQGCEIISMSLGGQGPVAPAYRRAAQHALANNCLIIAAAGNDSIRPSVIRSTSAPANTPEIISVAAIDSQLAVADFSNGGKIEIAAPGVNVFSTVPMSRRYSTKSGTSMAAPHVAGIAALWAESDVTLRGSNLANRLIAAAQPLHAPASDVGAGLVRAP